MEYGKKLAFIFSSFVTMQLFLGCASIDSASSKKDQAKTARHHLDLAQSLLQSNRNPEALTELKKALLLDPLNEDIHHQMALALMERRAYRQAVKYFQSALEINATSTEIRNNFIKTLLSLKQHKLAYRLARKSVVDLTYPKPIESHYLLALSAGPLGRLEESERYFKKILTQDKNHCGANYHLSKSYYKNKKIKKSFVLLNRASQFCVATDDKLKAQKALIVLKKKINR